MEEWMALPKIARKLDMPESSARRYAAALEQLIPQRKAGRLVLLHAPTAEMVLPKAAELFAAGLRLQQVRDRLQSEMPRADMAVVEDIHQDATTQPVQLEAMPVELMRAVNAIREDMTVMASTLERTQAELRDERKAREVLADENEELRQKMGVLENELVRLRKDRRDLEVYLVDKITKLSKT